jgi:hypothetical protein
VKGEERKTVGLCGWRIKWGDGRGRGGPRGERRGGGDMKGAAAGLGGGGMERGGDGNLGGGICSFQAITPCMPESCGHYQSSLFLSLNFASPAHLMITRLTLYLQLSVEEKGKYLDMCYNHKKKLFHIYARKLANRNMILKFCPKMVF